jgi:hypothetical protein
MPHTSTHEWINRVTNTVDENGIVTAVKQGNVTREDASIKENSQGRLGELVKTEMIRFPENVSSEHPTYVKYDIIEFIPIGSGTSKHRSRTTLGVSSNKVILKSIALMEQFQHETSEKQKWNQEAAGGIIDQLGKNIIGNLAKGNVAGAGGAVADSGSQLMGTTADFIAKKAAAASGGLTGIAVQDKMALKYDGPDGSRSFSTSHLFVPKSREESNTIRKIIKEFRSAAAPSMEKDLTGGGSAYVSYKYPHLFNVTRMVWDGINENYPDFDLAYCTDVSVKYGDSEGTTFMDDNSPISFELTLSFTEIGISHRDTVQEGF